MKYGRLVTALWLLAMVFHLPLVCDVGKSLIGPNEAQAQTVDDTSATPAQKRYRQPGVNPSGMPLEWGDFMTAQKAAAPPPWLQPVLPSSTLCHKMLNTSFARMEQAEKLYATGDRMKIDPADRLRGSANTYANMAAACLATIKSVN